MSLREQLCYDDVWLDVCKYFSVWTVVNVHCFNDDVSGLMVFNIPAHSPGLRPRLIMQISDLKDTRDKNMSTHSHPATRRQKGGSISQIIQGIIAQRHILLHATLNAV